MKTCTKCGERKPLEAFSVSRPGQSKDGYHGVCRVCRNLDSQAWRQNNPERMRELRRRWALKAKYGITRKEFDVMLEAQEGKCAICGTDEPGGKGWCVEHNHLTKVVRGIVCNNCNVMIGMADEDIVILQAAIDYLVERNN
jgi:hypothetical protein